MAVVQNANEEHQFLFAVNTISMVKSDALFSYIAPTNIIAWLLTPIRFIMPFRSFVKMNRTLIKVTHFPILFAIFTYERVILSHVAFQPEELVERRGRSRAKVPAAFSVPGGELFSPGNRLREPSITTFHKDRALDEVFRRPFTGPAPTTNQNASDNVDDRRKSSNVVRDWMQGMGHEGGASPPMEEPRSVLERLEHARRPPGMRRSKTAKMVVTRRTFATVPRSVASDPDVTPTVANMARVVPDFDDAVLMSMDEQPQQTDADGDDELLTNDENEDDRVTLGQSVRGTAPTRSDTNRPVNESSASEDFRTPMATLSHTPVIPSSVDSRIRDQPPSLLKASNAVQKGRHHHRNTSSNTILFSPEKNGFVSGHESTSTTPAKRPGTAHRSGATTPHTKPTPKRPTANPPNLRRPNHSPRSNMSSPNLAGIGFGNLPRPNRNRDPSFNALALDLASDIGDNRPRHELHGIPGMSASFSTQMEMAAMGDRRFRRRNMDDEHEDDVEEDRTRTNRILLARMNTLEESFKEVLKEVKGLGNRNGGHAVDKKGKGKKGTRTPGTPGTGSRTPGGNSAGGNSAGGESTGTAIHDGNGDDRGSIMRIDEEDDGDSEASL